MPQPWSALFQINQNPLMALNLEGVTQAMADRAPAERVNSVTWILRHILEYRIETLAVVQPASSGSSRPEPRTLPEFAAAFDEVQAALARAFDAVEDWTAVKGHPALPAPMPLDQLIGVFLSHEAYHIGQIAIARKLLGLPGAIKEAKKLAHA